MDWARCNDERRDQTHQASNVETEGTHMEWGKWEGRRVSVEQ